MKVKEILPIIDARAVTLASKKVIGTNKNILTIFKKPETKISIFGRYDLKPKIDNNLKFVFNDYYVIRIEFKNNYDSPIIWIQKDDPDKENDNED